MRFWVTTAIVISLSSGFTAGGANLPTSPKQVIPLDGVEGRIDHMAVDTKSGRLFVSALGNNTVEVIDMAAGKRTKTIKGPQEPQGIAVVPTSQRVVIASGTDGKCRIYDSTLTLSSDIDDLDDADNVRYDAKTGQAVVGYGKGALVFIDPQTGKKVSEVTLDGHPESFQLEKAGRRIFVNVPSARHVAIVDRHQGKVVAKWTLPGARSNFPMALDEANHRLFIGCRSPAKLLVLDSDTGKTGTAVDIVGDTDDLFYDAARKRIYVSGGAGRVSVIAQENADKYSLLGEILTASGARTSYFVPGSGLLYVAVPHRGQQRAELRVYNMADPAASLSRPPLTLSQTIKLPLVTGGFNHHSADGKYHRIVLCAPGNKSVEVLDLSTAKIVKSIPCDRSAAVCFADNLDILAVSRGKAVELYDGKTFELLESLPMPSSIDELHYDPVARQMYCGAMTAPAEGIVPIDLAARKVRGLLNLPSKPQGFCLEENGTRIFACTPGKQQICIVDRRNPAASDAWKLTDALSCYPVAFDASTHRLFVGCRRPAKLLVFNTDTGKTVASVDCGKDTDDLSFDAANKRIYLACGEGVISVIQQDDADHYRNTATIVTAPDARNSVFVPETGEFCVTVPQSGNHPAEVLVYKAQASAP
jgi:DNA-binding beta-propeller fold protein YncE